QEANPAVERDTNRGVRRPQAADERPDGCTRAHRADRRDRAQAGVRGPARRRHRDGRALSDGALMARPERAPLEGPAAVGIGRSLSVFRFRDKAVQVLGAFTGKLLLEASIGGDEYAPIGQPISAPGLVPVPLTVEFLRMRVLELTAGTPKAVFAGF